MSTAKTTLHPANELSNLRVRMQNQLRQTTTLEPEQAQRSLGYEKRGLQNTVQLDDPSGLGVLRYLMPNGNGGSEYRQATNIRRIGFGTLVNSQAVGSAGPK